VAIKILFSQEHLSYTFQYLFPTFIRLELLSPGTSKALPTFACAFIDEVFLLWLILLLLLSFFQAFSNIIYS